MVDLIIGPDPTAKAHFGTTLAVWDQFRTRLAAPLPFDIARLDENLFQQNCSGVAVAMPELGNSPHPDLGRIALSIRFFESGANEQFSNPAP